MYKNKFYVTLISTTPSPPACSSSNCKKAISQTNFHAEIDVNGCVIAEDKTINGENYSVFGVPGLKFHATNLNEQNLISTRKTYNFYRFEANPSPPQSSSISKIITNSTDHNVKGSGIYYCRTNSNNCEVNSSNEIGYGDKNNLTITFDYTMFGKFHLILSEIYKSKPGTISPYIVNSNETSNREHYNENVYIGRPSLLIVGPSDLNTGFYEIGGIYRRKIFYTLINTSPIDINLQNYKLKCQSSVDTNCVINARYGGFNIPGNNGKIILSGFIDVNKSNLPASVGVSLDVNYKVPALQISNCQSSYKNTISTFSKPVLFRLGLLDKQQFQVAIVSDIDSKDCLGENGMVGHTGENFIPRVNIGFGGERDSDNKLVSIDECDLFKISGEKNNWVYCSRKEFLVSLAAKIKSAWELKESTNIDQYRKIISFQTNIRKQSFSKQEISSSVESIISTNSIFQNIGYENVEGATPQDQATRFRDLMSKINFTYHGGEFTGALNAGTYTVNINLQELNNNSNQLFNPDNNLNPNVYINVDFSTTPTLPEFDWFFYDYANEDFNELTHPSANTFKSTNIDNRGKILTVNQNNLREGSFNHMFYPNYAVPLFVRLKTDQDGRLISKFTTSDYGIVSDIYSYWTGFASSSIDGCQNIVSTEGTLPYRETDQRVSNTIRDYNFPQFMDNKPNNTIYLQTILFWPINLPNNQTITAPFNLYTKDSSNTVNTDFRVNENNTTSTNNFYINDSKTLFNAIGDGKVCINKTSNGTNTIWTLYWNYNKIYQDINQTKINIVNQNKDAVICAIRESSGA